MHRYLIGLSLLLGLAGCANNSSPGHFSDHYTRYHTGKKTPAPIKATSRSYNIRGVDYHPQAHYEYVADGTASYYGGRDIFHGRPTSTGERFDKNGLTAAHRTLPLPCIVRVTNLENGRSVIVKVNDRGPYASTDHRIIDVSERTAKLLGFYGKGTARVRVETCVNESVRFANGAPVKVPDQPMFSFTPYQKQPAARLPYTVATKSFTRKKPVATLPYNKRSGDLLKKANGRLIVATKMRKKPLLKIAAKKAVPLPKLKEKRRNRG